MQKIEVPDNLIRSAPQKMAELRNSLCGTKKRFDAITFFLLSEWHNIFNKKYTHTNLVSYLDRKLKKNEGYIIDYKLYEKLFLKTPSELDVADLQHLFGRVDISLSPVYRKINGEPFVLFIIVHRNAFEAVAASNRLREILTGEQQNKVQMSFIRAALIVSEQLGEIIERNNTVTKEDICESMTFSNDDAYLISMNFCMAYRIDPKQLGDLLEKDFKISYLKRDQKAEEIIEAYKFYENLIGIVVSRTDEGIRLAHENLGILFRVCEATEEGLPKAVENTIGV